MARAGGFSCAALACGGLDARARGRRRCVVDAKHLLQHLEDGKRGGDAGAINEAVQQIAFSDLILLNKVDLVSPADKQDVLDAIRRINNTARIIECSLTSESGRPPVDQVLNTNSFSVQRALAVSGARSPRPTNIPPTSECVGPQRQRKHRQADPPLCFGGEMCPALPATRLPACWRGAQVDPTFLDTDSDAESLLPAQPSWEGLGEQQQQQHEHKCDHDHVAEAVQQQHQHGEARAPAPAAAAQPPAEAAEEAGAEPGGAGRKRQLGEAVPCQCGPESAVSGSRRRRRGGFPALANAVACLCVYERGGAPGEAARRLVLQLGDDAGPRGGDGNGCHLAMLITQRGASVPWRGWCPDWEWGCRTRRSPSGGARSCTTSAT